MEAANRKLVTVLLESGASARALNNAGNTALHMAVRHAVGKERNRLAEALLSVSIFPSLLNAPAESCVYCLGARLLWQLFSST